MCVYIYFQNDEVVNNESHMYTYNHDDVKFRHFTQALPFEIYLRLKFVRFKK